VNQANININEEKTLGNNSSRIDTMKKEQSMSIATKLAVDTTLKLLAGDVTSPGHSSMALT